MNYYSYIFRILFELNSNCKHLIPLKTSILYPQLYHLLTWGDYSLSYFLKAEKSSGVLKLSVISISFYIAFKAIVVYYSP